MRKQNDQTLDLLWLKYQDSILVSISISKLGDNSEGHHYLACFDKLAFNFYFLKESKYKYIHVIRETSYGYGDSFPCLKCRASLERLDIRVVSHYNGEEITFRMSDCPIESKYTSGQILNRQPHRACIVQSGHSTRRSQKTHSLNYC